MTESFPLHWPDGWPRTPLDKRKWSLAGGRRNTQGWDVVLRRLRDEIARIGGGELVISTNQPLRQDGMPYSQQRSISDSGTAIYFTRDGRELAMAQDTYELIQDNLRSLAIAIEGLRQMERHGGAVMIERAFRGFEALPAPGVKQWRHVLGSAVATLGDAEARYILLAKERHPDRPNGSDGAMADLNVAIRMAREELTP